MMLPSNLIAAVKEQRAVLFLGAGASFGARHPRNAALPLGDSLRDAISDHFLSGALKDRSLTAVAAMSANEAGLLHLQEYIHDLFDPFNPADFHILLPQFRWKAIATTNFDLIIERSYTYTSNALQTLVKTVKDGDLFDTRMTKAESPVGLYKLHGCIEYYSDESIPLILGQEQYASYASNRQRFYARLRDLAYEYPIIFCGYSITDPHIQNMLFDLTDRNIKRPMFYHVAPGTDDIEVRYWATHQITCLKGTYAEFLQTLDGAIPAIARSLPAGLGGGALSIRRHYRVAFAPESQSLQLYLKTDATHVHAGMAVERQDPVEFYKGYDRGWGGIAQNLDVRRGVCDSVLVDAVLTSDDSCQPGPTLFMLKGPAGNGKTVALKRIAWDAAIIYEQMVLYVTEAAGLRIEPIKEICLLTGKRLYIFIDRVGLLRDELLNFLGSCRSQKLPVTVIGAERDNEWNIYCENLERFVVQDFRVDYLSEKSIVRLLELLGSHKALGLLRDKSLQEQIEAFTQRAEKQLLVALHETTLGIPFEKIVFDEYKGIEPAEARRLYLHICVLHQFGASVRAGLISRTSGVDFLNFNKRLISPLENVVILEEERHTGDLFYRSRHQHVAELVFNQVLQSDDDKYDVLREIMQSINIDYSSDKETWGRMIRGRSVARMFASVGIGRLFYDRAEELAPNEAFVFHQRAVFEMQHRDGLLGLAEAAARTAFERHGSRSIRHTQAEIARRQAADTTDPLRKQALRRLAREKLGRETGRATEYDVSTRARLAIDELRELLLAGRDLDASYQGILLDAVKEAETTIQHGLQAFPESSDILAVEASFRQLLEQAERARQSLERAFGLNPRQDWLAVRLSRSHMESDNPEQAARILERCLKENPSSKAAHLEIARIYMKLQKPAGLIIDHLRRSSTVGDNHYEGQFWYARELFIQGRIEDSASRFAQLHENAPGRYRTAASATWNDVSGKPMALRGQVERKENGYAFVRFAKFKECIFASRADSDGDVWDAIRTGFTVRSQLAFNRRGPRAVKLSQT